MTEPTKAKLAFLSQPDPAQETFVLIVQTEGRSGITRGLTDTQQFEITRGMLRNIVGDGFEMLMGMPV